MRRHFAVTSCVLACASTAALSQDNQLAREGRGLLPPPVALAVAAAEVAHPFVADPSGPFFSRVVFETDEDPNVKWVIRDYSFPPAQAPHTVTLAAGGLLHKLGGTAEISLANTRLALTPANRTVAPAGAALQVLNRGDEAVVIRHISLETK
jgi:hypothetical protein